MWNAIKHNRLSLAIAFVACVLSVVGILFEVWIVIIPLIVTAYWLAASQTTEEIIRRREAKKRGQH